MIDEDCPKPENALANLLAPSRYCHKPIDYDDPQGMVERIAESYTVTMNRRITLTSGSELGYVFGLVEQSYQNVL